ncbi:class III lanthionine synthetase LanKC [Symbioplanes lichenis]|uniref:class III lanthionine synthetase LanKC n=1 Tax=Symbioplanes lichenis TaxID=1629072 RepID=UPI002738DBBE|nr:class III lanthionine synthetase LanKC [Actinoplanes lichenis]
MDKRYDSFCAVDPLFYDSLSSAPAQEFPAGDRPDGWRRQASEDWTIWAPAAGESRPQGWKVHVSATLGNAERVLATVRDYCVPRGLAFKHLRGPKLLLMRNSKYAARGASGKFVTIYPRDDAELATICAELAELLAGEPGPYILSDLRYGDGPVYVRYGSFSKRYCLRDGQVVPAIADASGALVPDRRDPVFHVPEWVTLPAFLEPHLAAREAVSTTQVPYKIERALHFSNGGGLYVGRDLRTDEVVVLKEARPGAGLDATGTDAVTRLRRERDMLLRLAGVPGIVRVHDSFTLGEHEFLALSYVTGEPLNKLLVQRHPLVEAPTRRADYTRWALGVHAQVARIIGDIHRAGVVYGDLHLFNVLVDDEDRVTLLDFEVARPVAEPGPPALRNQAFAAPRDRTGFAVDDYALACLRLALFLPLTSMLRLAPAKVTHLADIIAEHFPVPRAELDESVRVILGPRPAPPFETTDTRRRLADGITASASPVRTDRLFPGDIEQFRSGGVNLAHGAAGVLWALAETQMPVDPAHEQWLADRAHAPESGSRLGFHDGLHGVAWALHRLGRKDEAVALLDRCLAEPWRDLGSDLGGGLAGIGLNLAWFAGATGDHRYADAAAQVTDLVAARLRAAPPAATTSGGAHPWAGLHRGAAGPALLFLHRYEQTGDEAMLDLAARALRRDLCACVIRENGAMSVDEGWRTMPYLADGSVGIGLVIDRYLSHRADEQFTTASAAIRRAACFPFYVQPGLFAGRAGIVAYLAARVAAGLDEPGELRRQSGLLSWHLLPFGRHLAVPGNQLLRLSMDLATGSAGVLLARAMADDPALALPFLGPIPGRTAARAARSPVLGRTAARAAQSPVLGRTAAPAAPSPADAPDASPGPTDFRRAEETPSVHSHQIGETP